MKLSGALIIAFLVIVVIAYVANRGFTCGRSPAQADVSSIALAVVNFHTDYGRLPAVPERVTTDTQDGLKLLNILQGLGSPDEVSQNPKAVRYLSIREARNNRGGVTYDSAGSMVLSLSDDWGSPFTVVLDTDGDNVLEFHLGSREIRLDGRSVAVVSPGKDRKLGTFDDVKSW